MELQPYLDSLRRDLTAAAAPGGDDVARAADLLGGSLEASARMCLLEALSDAAAEITTKLDNTSVEVRLRGREAQFVVTNQVEPPPAAQPGPASAAPPTIDESGDIARLTLRLPEGLKDAVERAAAAESISVNAWLVRAITMVLTGPPGFPPPYPPGPFAPGNYSPPGAPPPGRGRMGRRVTGFAQA
jgi:HicB family